MPLAITKCDLLRAEVTQQADGTSTAVQEWLIETNEPTGPAWATANAHAFNASYPIAGQAFTDGYSSSSYLQAANITTRWVDAPNCKSLFTSIVQFVSPGAPGVAQVTRDPAVAPTGDPLDEPPVIYYTVNKTKEAFLKDLDGKAICSSAGEPYNPVQERDRTLYNLHIERNVATDSSLDNSTYRDSVNENSFWGHAAGQAKCEIPGLVQRLYTPSGQKYFRETWEFSFDDKDEGHQLILHDWGYKKKDGSGGVVTIKGTDDEFLTSPTFLDGSGEPLDPQPPDSTPVDIPNPLVAPYFKRYKIKDFDDLGLPTSM